jgi:glycine/D-amino acid oxidase-like deaminating enzyme
MESAAERSLADAKPVVFWTDRSDAPDPAQSLTRNIKVDLAIVGGGFSGLWAAVVASERDPGRSIVVLEAEVTGFGASSRNGGFLDASLTHGLGNGLSHWPGEMQTLVRMGDQNFDEIISFVRDNDLDVGLETTGAIHVATAPWHLDELVEYQSVMDSFGIESELLDKGAMRAEVDSPTYVGGLRDPHGTAIIDPARMVWSLRRFAESRGVVFNDHSPVRSVLRSQSGLVVATDNGNVVADKVVVATNAYAGPAKAMKRYIVPVYDYVLMTEPLSMAHMESIGWKGRQGLEDGNSQFHYYRLTTDNRILWGGYDAVYRYGSKVDPAYDQAGTTHATLARQFFEAFPQLEGLMFTHKWAGPIATTSRFTATWGTSHDGDLAWVGGYTGLGVGATRFGATVALDLVDGLDSERTELSMVRKKPMPFPPEPFRSAGIQLTRRAIAKSDEREGRRGLWLKLLDRFGVGFDS